jgi:hypothetical protein
MLNLNKSSVEYRIVLGSIFCPIVAFVIGYYLLKKKVLFIAGLASVFLYGLLIAKYEWIDVVKLNICLTGFYFTGCYPYVISKLGLFALKICMFIAVLASPIYVLNLIPNNTIDFVFSFLLTFSGFILVFFSQRPKQLINKR